MASTTRDLSSSIEYRLWQLLYQAGWHNAYEGVALTRLAEPQFPANSYGILKGFPWVWWDAGVKNPSRNHITVYRNGTPMAPSSYVVNFKGGYVSFKVPTTGVITADLSHFTVNVMEGYPDDDVLEMTELPVVAFEVTGKSGRPFAIATSTREWSHPVDIDILAPNDGSAKDVMDEVTERIRHVPLIGMADAPMLGNDGDVNPNFNFDLQYEHWLIPSPDPGGRLLAPRQNGSDKERHRAKVSLGLKIVR